MSDLLGIPLLGHPFTPLALSLAQFVLVLGFLPLHPRYRNPPPYPLDVPSRDHNWHRHLGLPVPRRCPPQPLGLLRSRPHLRSRRPEELEEL